ncbi:LysR family hydrogen peroxide-inducible transcriptional activator [Paracoccus pantotrophus]|uniref:LysR family hydrogen peroxide-inducible transcriptional activator n=2 Tax=Paracoccus TaxID=265 RepID=A0AAE6NWQ1_PARPN|nr:hydrogen peroxide-inducible genes activator [Paracoccus pantotrophus]QFG38001.1 LysR family transcriptional regulator [Paracoccus pantotrophus]RKS51511.1 LysR family hydrogen peroxide-inducible transcriptional activator [Paracoccus pantotrophus]
MNFTLRQITYFLAVARLGHFGRAAETVHVSQPGLSSQIAQLEARLGGALFERGAGAGPVRLTALGERLLPVAQELIDTAKRLEALARAGRLPLSGRLRLAIIPTVAPYLIPHLVPALRAGHPMLDLELHEIATDEVVSGVLGHRFDAGIMALPVNEPGIEAEPVLRDAFLVALSGRDTTLLSGPARPESIEADRLLLLADGHCLRDQALEVCGLRSPRRKLNLEAASMATLMGMVASGMGMTLIPRLALADENRDGRLRIVPFTEPAPSRDLAVVWRRNAEAGADARALAQAVRELAPVLGVEPIPRPAPDPLPDTPVRKRISAGRS